MKYKLWLLDFITGRFEYANIGYFKLQHLEFNMKHRWAWNDIEKQRENNDGQCCYIQY